MQISQDNYRSIPTTKPKRFLSQFSYHSSSCYRLIQNGLPSLSCRIPNVHDSEIADVPLFSPVSDPSRPKSCRYLNSFSHAWVFELFYPSQWHVFIHSRRDCMAGYLHKITHGQLKGKAKDSSGKFVHYNIENDIPHRPTNIKSPVKIVNKQNANTSQRVFQEDGRIPIINWN